MQSIKQRPPPSEEESSNYTHTSSHTTSHKNILQNRPQIPSKMSSPNEIYWSYIAQHIECVAAEYVLSSTYSIVTTILTSNRSFSPKSTLTDDDLYCECELPFYMCNYCKAKEQAKPAEYLPADLYTAEHFAAEYTVAVQEAQLVADWVGLYLASPEPQASLDALLCEGELGRRIWAQGTRILKEMRKDGGVVRVSRGSG